MWIHTTFRYSTSKTLKVTGRIVIYLTSRLRYIEIKDTYRKKGIYK